MRSSDGRSPSTHGVTVGADDLDVSGVDVLDGGLALGVAVRDDGLDLLGGLGGELGHGVVGDDAALGVAGHDELGVGALLDGLVGELGHGGFALVVTAGDVAAEVGWVVDALDGDFVFADG